MQLPPCCFDQKPPKFMPHIPPVPMAKSKRSKERMCRKNIATFLSLMGFQDGDLDTTIQMMFRKLHEIEEKQHTVVTEVKRSRIRKVTFKSHGESYVHVVVQAEDEDPTLMVDQYFNPTHSEIVVDDVEDAIEETLCSENPRFYRMEIVNSSGSSAVLGGGVGHVSIELLNFISNMGGSDTGSVIEKRLTTTDVTSNQGRLLIPALKVKKSDFLTRGEKTKLGKRQDISVRVFDPEGREWTLNLAQWKMKNENYVLRTGWNQVVKTNGLKENMVVQVWSFRVEQQLCFAILAY